MQGDTSANTATSQTSQSNEWLSSREVDMYFVMLQHPVESVPAQPLISSALHGDEVMFFDDEETAHTEAKKSWLGGTLGYEVFQLGLGEAG